MNLKRWTIRFSKGSGMSAVMQKVRQKQQKQRKQIQLKQTQQEQNNRKTKELESSYFCGAGYRCAAMPYCREGKSAISFWGILRTLTYIGLYIGWGISIHKRVVQKAAKNTLIFISGLMIFWFIVRSIKYFLRWM